MHSFADRGEDLYETPECATISLLNTNILNEIMTKDTILWEPSAGRGAISRVIKERTNFSVIAQDLCAYEGADDYVIPHKNFLEETQAPSNKTVIVTNPPYKIADKFIRHALTLSPHVIVLLRLMAIEGKNRSDLIDSHCKTIYAGIERLPLMHREGWTGKRQKSSGAPFAWFHFTQQKTNGRIELQRISWRHE